MNKLGSAVITVAVMNKYTILRIENVDTMYQKSSHLSLIVIILLTNLVKGKWPMAAVCRLHGGAGLGRTQA